MKAAAFDYARAADADEAVRLLAQSEGMGKVMAGSQSLGPMMNLRLAQPSLLVDVRGIEALRAAAENAEAVTLGACTTHAGIEDGIAPDPTRGLMPFVARGIAYRAVRNRGTLGGSLAHADPAADWINAMALLDAEYLVQGIGGERRVAAKDWMLGTFTTALGEAELLTGIRIPRLGAGARWSYYKFNRKTGEFAEAIAAFVDDPERGRCRAVIGALDGAPIVIDDARPLLAGDADARRAALARAGLEAGSYEYRIHRAALDRAAAALARTSPLERRA